MNFEGDINLFGHENNRNLEKLILDFDQLDFDQLAIVQDLATVITHLIRRVKSFHMSESKKLQSYIN